MLLVVGTEADFQSTHEPGASIAYINIGKFPGYVQNQWQTKNILAGSQTYKLGRPTNHFSRQHFQTHPPLPRLNFPSHHSSCKTFFLCKTMRISRIAAEVLQQSNPLSVAKYLNILLRCFGVADRPILHNFGVPFPLLWK